MLKNITLSFLIILLIWFPALLFAQDASSNAGLLEKYNELETRYNTLKAKLDKAVALLERYSDATPEIDEFTQTDIKFHILDMKYSFSYPGLDLTGKWYKNIEIGLSFEFPSFQTFNNFDIANGKIKLSIGYNLFGFHLYTNYDFINDWRLGLTINLFDIVDLFVDKRG